MKYKNIFRNFFFFTFRKITVGGFVNQHIKKFWPKQKKTVTYLTVAIHMLTENSHQNRLKREWTTFVS